MPVAHERNPAANAPRLQLPASSHCFYVSPQVLVYDRNPAAVAALEKQGARAAASPRDIAETPGEGGGVLKSFNTGLVYVQQGARAAASLFFFATRDCRDAW